jgi:hypothetical protein
MSTTYYDYHEKYFAAAAEMLAQKTISYGQFNREVDCLLK